MQPNLSFEMDPETFVWLDFHVKFIPVPTLKHNGAVELEVWLDSLTSALDVLLAI
jgi:hypothetical protein